LSAISLHLGARSRSSQRRPASAERTQPGNDQATSVSAVAAGDATEAVATTRWCTKTTTPRLLRDGRAPIARCKHLQPRCSYASVVPSLSGRRPVFRQNRLSGQTGPPAPCSPAAPRSLSGGARSRARSPPPRAPPPLPCRLCVSAHGLGAQVRRGYCDTAISVPERPSCSQDVTGSQTVYRSLSCWQDLSR
jgi:hypothetical protein